MEELTAAFLRQVADSFRQSPVEGGETGVAAILLCSGSQFYKKAAAKQVLHWILSGVCATQFIKLWTRFGKNVSPQPWTWEQQLQYRTLYNVLQTQQEGIKTGTTGCGIYCFRYLYKSVFPDVHPSIITHRDFDKEAAQTYIVWGGSWYNLHCGPGRKWNCFQI